MPRRPSARTRSWPATIAIRIVQALFILFFASFLWVLLYRFVNPPITFTMIADRLQGRTLTREWMPIAQIDRNMVRAAIAAEDSKFCSHWGFDQDAIAAAMKRNARGGSVIRGGSTISQQTAKNAFLWQGGGYLRKGVEAWFTLLIENLWGKRRIMEVYLNLAETGIGTYGVNAGSERYFGHCVLVGIFVGVAGVRRIVGGTHRGVGLVTVAGDGVHDTDQGVPQHVLAEPVALAHHGADHRPGDR